MNLQKHIRKVLTEDMKVRSFILRRVNADELEKEFSESLEDASEIYYRRELSLREFKNIIISMTIDGIHWYLHSQTPDHSQWYQDVYNYLANHYNDMIEKRYKLLSEE